MCKKSWIDRDMDVPIVANVLGTIGAICWSVQVPASCNSSMLQHMNDTPPLLLADTPNHNQLPAPRYHRLATLNDAPLGLRRSTFRCLQHHRELQHRTTDTSSNIDISELTDMEPVLLLRGALEP